MKKILIVDDDKVLLKGFTNAVSAYARDFAAITAENGQDAVKVLEEHSIDIVLTDLNMPVMNGFQLLSYISQQCPFVPVIVMTTYDIKELETTFKNHSSISYLQKPLQVQKVIEDIRSKIIRSSKGFIEGVTLFSFVQLVNLEQKTCLLRVKSQHDEGLLHFANGELANAFHAGTTGENAAYHILSWDEVQIEMKDVSLSVKRSINLPLSHVLMEAVRLKDEQMEAQAVGTQQIEAENGASVPEIAPADPITLDIEQVTLDIEPVLLTELPKELDVSNVKQTLDEAMKIDGAVGVALVDLKSGMCLGTAGGNSSMNLEVAGAGNMEVVRAKFKVMNALGIKERIEDILITLSGQYHIIRLLGSSQSLFLYLVLSRENANLAMARHKLASLETTLAV